MANTIKNLVIIIGFIALAFGGYFLYLTNFVDNEFVTAPQNSEDMYRRAQEFISHRSVLDSISINDSLFYDERFLSLVSYTSPVSELPVGRIDPFAEVGTNSN